VVSLPLFALLVYIPHLGNTLKLMDCNALVIQVPYMADPLVISIIIPARNAEKTLEQCLVAVLDQKGIKDPYEVIVVDDGSTDQTEAIARRFAVQVLRLEGEGPASARNAGADVARGEILLFTDADCEPTDTWISEMMRSFEDPEVVGVRGAYKTRQRELTARFVQLEYAFKYKRMARLETIDFVDTYSAGYRREVFLENEGFNRSLLRNQDQEFSFRLARKGYKMVFNPKAIVYHLHARTLGAYASRKFSIGYWKAFLLRWLPEKALSDSHTPWMQRFQTVLLLVAVASVLVGFIWQPAAVAAVAALFIFLVTSIPIMAHVVSEDSELIFLVPLLLFVRAAALGVGLVVGSVFPPKERPAVVVGFSFPVWFTKRLIDIVGSAAGLILSAPLMGLTAIFIKLDNPGPVLFRQERVGENGHTFQMVKLRTMVVGAEAQVSQVMATNPLEGPVFKIPNDPRVTRLGYYLRRLSLDEVPQLWNVLKGEMSLVGPRPEESWIVDQYDDRQRGRLVVKPGLTGPAQISGRGDLNMEERLELELDYINNYSVLRDLVIMIKSVPAVLTGKGAY
jgi:lipopolysaccharide/colanic/teichoic acid biosynthesis glycosyltransferase/glycosyltransferase involved in cell wall biosynthesis